MPYATYSAKLEESIVNHNYDIYLERESTSYGVHQEIDGFDYSDTGFAVRFEQKERDWVQSNYYYG